MEFGIEGLFLMGEPFLVFTSVYNLILKIRFASNTTEIQSCCESKRYYSTEVFKEKKWNYS